MKTKIEPKYTYEGLGFPIELENVAMVLVEDEWCAQIDILQVCEDTMNKLVENEEKLDYNKTNFVCQYLMYLVHKVLNDREKTMLWFNTPNASLENSIPRHIVKAGKYKKLFEFIKTAVEEDRGEL